MSAGCKCWEQRVACVIRPAMGLLAVSSCAAAEVIKRCCGKGWTLATVNLSGVVESSVTNARTKEMNTFAIEIIDMHYSTSNTC